MADRDQIEQQIREALTRETRAIPLSNLLAGTEAERRVVAQSPLFRQAQKRLSELQRQEAEEFGRVVRQAEETVPEGGLWLHLEYPNNP